MVDDPSRIFRPDGTPVEVHYHPPNHCPDCTVSEVRIIDEPIEATGARLRAYNFEADADSHGVPSEALSEQPSPVSYYFYRPHYREALALCINDPECNGHAVRHKIGNTYHVRRHDGTEHEITRESYERRDIR